MAKIKTTKGYFKYKPISIFEGVKRINKTQAEENLLLLKDVLDKNGITFQLAYGTLLGAVREHDFIDHDEDIDLALRDEYKMSFMDLLEDLKLIGFEVARYDRRGLISIIRKGEYIDLYFFKKWGKRVRTSSGCLMLERFLLDSTALDFRGSNYKVPREYEEFLICEYGDNWMTPVQYFNYDPSRFKLWTQKVVYQIKEIMPDCLYNLLIPYYERKLEEKYIKKINEYLVKKNEPCLKKQLFE